MLNQDLLASSANAPSRRNRQVMIAATVAGLLLSASFVGYSVGKMSATSEAKSGFHVAAVNESTALLDGVHYDAKCFGYTGGSCHILSCNAVRNATCTGMETGHCECVGSCTGADGNCHKHVQQYTRVASKVKFTSVLYPDFWLLMSNERTWNLWNQLRIENSKTWSWSGQQFFDIYMLPGKVPKALDEKQRKRFFMESNKYKNWIASVIGGSEFKMRAHTYGLYAKNLQSDLMEWNPVQASMILCHVPGKPNVIKMGRPVIPPVLGAWDSWAYVHSLSKYADATYKVWDGSDSQSEMHWLVSDEEDRAVSLEGAIDECDE